MGVMYIGSMDTLISPESVIAGDVLLCFDKVLASKAKEETGSNYSHSAICIRQNEIAESDHAGVKKSCLLEFASDHDAIAILRPHPGCWTPDRVEKLNTFIDAAILRKAKFNIEGFQNFESTVQNHKENIFIKLEKYFAGDLLPNNPEKPEYFCSELVVACFYYCQILTDSAAIYYQPDAHRTGKLSKDPTFGLFVGHLEVYDGFEVPKEDEFLTTGRYHDVYPENET